MKNDRIAHLSLVIDAEKKHLPQHQVAQANEAYRQRTTIDSSWIFVRAMKFLTLVTLVAVAYRLIIMWWA